MKTQICRYLLSIFLLTVNCVAGHNSTLTQEVIKKRQLEAIKQVKEYRNKKPTYKYIELKNCMWPVRSDLISSYNPENKFHSRHRHENYNVFYRISILSLDPPLTESRKDIYENYKAGKMEPEGEVSYIIHYIKKYKGFDIIAYEHIEGDPLDYDHGHNYVLLREDLMVMVNSYIDEKEVTNMIDHCVKTQRAKVTTVP